MTSTWWDRLRRVDPLVWDSLLAVLIAAIVAGTVASQEGVHGPAAWALTLAASAPLALRRRAPIPVLAAVGAAVFVFALTGNGGAADVALALAGYTVAAHEPWRRVATLGLPLALVADLASQLAGQTHRNWVEVVVGLTFSVGIPVLLGRIVFNRRRRLVVERESAAREAVALERTRIARELHDVVAHAMSVMIVQAGAARTVVDRDPAAAHEAIERVEETGRAGLAEMRRLIGVLTDDARAASTAPVPGLAELDQLLDTVRSAGLPVELVRTGTVSDLPTGADLTAYRVIQESLTNALKHAGPASARVALDYAPDRLTIEVADDGRGPSAEPGVGHGLIGMRERVGLFGGSLQTSERPGGGFLVRAEIPVTEDA
ncbi:MAG TPA: sensor histidine kinase [Actinomycetota bacterium]|nr:sensor histidine kinase [Actinomycetota bacterium]